MDAYWGLLQYILPSLHHKIWEQGSYAVWKATKANGQYDLRTFEVKARPVEAVEGLRPGMSVVIK